MPDFVYLNGEFVPAAEARISVFDHGFLYGDGLFETMRSYQGEIFLLDEHLNRLYTSAGLLELVLPWSKTELKSVFVRLIELNGPDLYIRLTVSRGAGPVGIDPRLCAAPTIVITSKVPAADEQVYHRGASAIFVKTMRNLQGATLPEVKSLNFLNNILAKQEVIKAGAHEGIMLNYLGQVTEGAVSNIFCVNNKTVLTPSLEAGLLAGVTRGCVLKIAERLDISCRESILYEQDVTEAEEVFYTNSGSGIVPVTKLDNKPVGSGSPGPITQKLMDSYNRLTVGR
ncbi:MAG: aminotransferase class IV [Thermincola sp.]|nr:aminotransferase class IV [Thermincola sp.]MDT3701989.1 aminotransferase class IV [Thermincola sp.]